MWIAIKQLLRPLSYLFIRDRSKIWFDFIFPGVFTLLILAGYVVIPVKPNVIAGTESIFENISQFALTMPGFFLVALSAVATFNHENMDKRLPYPTPYVYNNIKGVATKIELTRRRFLCMLLGYLTYISILFVLGLQILKSLHPALQTIANAWQCYALNIVYLLYVSVFVFHIIFITMFSIYQMAERMHRPDQD